MPDNPVSEMLTCMMLKWFWILFGSMSVLTGLLVIWSPLPLGLPLFMTGIPLLIKYSSHSRNSVLWLAATSRVCFSHCG